MRILVTNDDGIFHPGLETMVNVLQHFGEVYVVCPDKERSAISHSITLRNPIKAIPTNLFTSGVSSWMINGTPADCVKLAIEVLMKEPPDIVFSGINIGPNLGRDMYYSGTIAGAMEASLNQIPSVAVSLASFDSNYVNYQQVKALFYQIVEVILANKTPNGMMLNINMPYTSKELCRGVKVVPLDMGVERYRYVGLNDPHGQVYYWLKDQYQQLEVLKKGKDFSALREGYVTISPVGMKATNRRKIEQLNRWFQTFNRTKEELFHV
ncbi:5'/3'-nucleotidase SurE [Saliterribacillus persicus]|uniref:5'-nucleotidase SurE n=1 Tax=Saliterribacillus persicus TaxID=930114 RepID=A0A368Y6H6_9BACI|nr:5'/3'-nucleotidase SurE [Saliterribacillus persicus]RCW74926.1 5'-nucleotidase /3'-nucleotidase /exopolyphosphatase [Saliterribacillus persicus]